VAGVFFWGCVGVYHKQNKGLMGGGKGTEKTTGRRYQERYWWGLREVKKMEQLIGTFWQVEFI